MTYKRREKEILWVVFLSFLSPLRELFQPRIRPMRKYKRRLLGYLFGLIVFDNGHDNKKKLVNYNSFAILRLQLSDFCLSWELSFLGTVGALKDSSN